MLAGEAPTGDARAGRQRPLDAAAARLATSAALARRAPRGACAIIRRDAARRLRWVLAGALVAWTLIRALGLERGWPLVPLLAFTPYVALLALLVRRSWRGGRWWAARSSPAPARRALSCCWRRGRSRTARPRTRPACGCACSPPTSRATRRRRRRASTPSALGRRRLQRLELAARGRARVRRARASARCFPPRTAAAARASAGTGLYSRAAAARRARGPAAPRSRISRRRGGAPPRRGAGRAPRRPRAGPDRRRAPTGAWRHDMRALPSAGPRAAARAGGRLQRDARPRRAAAPARPRLPRRRRAGRDRAAPDLAGGPDLLPPLVTIDHVLADRRVRVISARSVAIPARTTGACSPSCCCRAAAQPRARSARSAGRGRRPGRRTPR